MNHCQAAIGITDAPINGTYVIRNSVFRNMAAPGGWRSGGVVGYAGNGNLNFVFENDEFSDIYAGLNGGVMRLEGTGTAVFANCTFHRAMNTGWGGAVDLRLANAYIVNCTAVGCRTTQNNDGSKYNAGAFTCFNNVKMLNTVCAFNARSGIANDTSKYSGTLAAYNGYNHMEGGSYNVSEAMNDYDDTTALFAEPFESISSVTYNNGNYKQTITGALDAPPLSVDVKAEAKDPAMRRIVEIVPKKDGGVLDRTGWPVKHSADWSSIAYTTDGGNTWTALVGDVAAATILLEADSRGVPYSINASTGLPKPPIGSAAAIKNTPTVIFIF